MRPLVYLHGVDEHPFLMNALPVYRHHIVNQVGIANGHPHPLGDALSGGRHHLRVNLGFVDYLWGGKSLQDFLRTGVEPLLRSSDIDLRHRKVGKHEAVPRLDAIDGVREVLVDAFVIMPRDGKHPTVV